MCYAERSAWPGIGDAQKIPYGHFCTLLVSDTVLILSVVSSGGYRSVVLQTFFDSYNSIEQLWRKKKITLHVLYLEVNFSLFLCHVSSCSFSNH